MGNIVKASDSQQPGTGLQAAALTFTEIMQYAEVFAKSQMFADVKDAAQAAVKIAAGQELGVPPFASMTGIFVIKGKPSIGAHILAAKIKASNRYDYVVEHADRQACQIAFYRLVLGGEPILMGKATYTINDANKAKLTGKDNWTLYADDMLYARAMTRGARRYCPDVINGIDITDDAPDVIEGTAREVPQHPTAEQGAAAVAMLRGPDDDAGLVGEPAQPASEPAQANGNGRTLAEVATGNWRDAATRLARECPYYRKLSGGKEVADLYHMRGAAYKLGFVVINDGNLADVFDGLVEYANKHADAEAAQPEAAPA